MTLKPHGDLLEIKDKNLALQLTKLNFQTPEGGTDSTWGDCYLIAFMLETQWGYPAPKIIGKIDNGIDPKWLLSDLDHDGTQEVLLFYHAGAHTYIVSAYRLTPPSHTMILHISLLPSNPISQAILEKST